MRPRHLIAALAAAAMPLLFAAPALAAPAITADGVQATEGQLVSLTVATFSDTSPLLSSCLDGSSYAATINWGDGTATSPASVTLTGSSFGLLGSSCQYAVTAAHLFAAAGQYSTQVSVSPGGGTGTTAGGTAAVADAPLSGSPAGALSVGAGAPLSGTLATFSDANHAGAAGDYTATIDWGDGSGGQPGSVSAVPAGGFRVTGGHTYASAGTFTVTVTVADRGGASTGPLHDTVRVGSGGAPPTGTTGGGAPTGSGSGSPAPSSGASPPAGAAKLRLRLGRVHLVGLHALSVAVGCPQGVRQCRGTLRATLRAPGGPAALRAAVLPATLFFVSGGQTATIDVQLPPRVRNALPGLHGLLQAVLRAMAFDPTGHAARANVKLTQTLRRR